MTWFKKRIVTVKGSVSESLDQRDANLSSFTQRPKGSTYGTTVPCDHARPRRSVPFITVAAKQTEDDHKIPKSV